MRSDEYFVYFTCDDEVIEEILETLACGRNVRGDFRRGYRCGWTLKYDSGHDEWDFVGTANQIVVLKFFGIEPEELPF